MREVIERCPQGRKRREEGRKMCGSRYGKRSEEAIRRFTK